MFCVVGLARAYGFDVLGRYASPDLASRNLCVLQHQGSSSNDTPFTHLTAIE